MSKLSLCVQSQNEIPDSSDLSILCVERYGETKYVCTLCRNFRFFSSQKIFICLSERLSPKFLYD